MVDKGRAKLFMLLWAGLGMCLAGGGCQTAESYRIVNGHLVPDRMLNGQDETRQASYRPDYGRDQSGVVQANYQTSRLGNNGRARLSFQSDGSNVVEGGPAPDAMSQQSSNGPTCNGPGCNGSPQGAMMDNGRDQPIPHELAKASLPAYVIEPPDILLIDPVRMSPLPNYALEPLDVVQIQVGGTPPSAPIVGNFVISPEGTVNLGLPYGAVSIGGYSVVEAQNVIQKYLRQKQLTDAEVGISLLQARALQQTRGEHLVRPDGTVSLGSYGCVYVTGLTISQAKCMIERHLSQFLNRPEISLDIYSYNSKFFYIITDGAGFGEQVFRFPIMGNETVLDGLSLVNGLPAVASKRKIWVARPAPCDLGCDQVLPVDWRAITEGGSTCTNYQLFPGDRIYVKADPLITLDNTLAKVIAPIERILGVTLLGEVTVQSFRRNGTTNNGSGFVATGF